MRIRWTRLVSVAAMLYFGGCSSMCAEEAARAHRAEEAQNYVFTQPPQEVWSTFGNVVQEAHSIEVPAQLPPFGVEQTYSLENTNEYRRSLVVLLTSVPPGFRMTVTSVSQRPENGAWGPPTPMNAGHLTFQVIERLDVGRAAQIDYAARQRGEQAQASCDRCQRTFLGVEESNSNSR